MKNRIYHIAVLALSMVLSACLSSPASLDVKDRPLHHTDRGFRNLYIEDPEKTFFDFMKMRYFSEMKWPRHADYSALIPWQTLDLDRILSPGDEPQLSWIGHSTFLVQYRGINVLTDPVFCDRVSPFSFAGPKRYMPHVMEYARLPSIDYVVISHNHYDHLDSQAMSRLASQAEPPRFYVPLGIKSWLLERYAQLAPDDVMEMDWGQEAVHNELLVNAYPSQHWSARSLNDRFKTLWASWRIGIGDFSFWFAGDTGYNERLFKELGESMPPVQLSLIPIGAYAPRFFMKYYHLNPEEAVMVHQKIKTRQSIGMHWGTYPLTAEAPTDPPERLATAARKAGLKFGEFSVMKLGETRKISLN